MDLGMIVPSKQSRERQISYAITFMRNLKTKTNNKHNKTEIELQIQRTERGSQREEGLKEGGNK